MNAHPKKGLVLSDHLAEQIAGMIEDGVIQGLDQVVEAGLSAIEPPDFDLETLRRAVLPALEESERDPSSMKSLEDTFAELRAHHARRLAEG